MRIKINHKFKRVYKNNNVLIENSRMEEEVERDMSIMETKELSISYGDRKIVSDLTVEIPKGKITTIIGPNGCGKSTILKTMSRI